MKSFLNKIFTKINDSTAPIVLVVILLCLGIIFEKVFALPFLLLCALLILVLLISVIFLQKSLSSNTVYLLFFILGAMLVVNSNTLANNHIVKVPFVFEQEVLVDGVVIDDPRVTKKRMSFSLKVDKLYFKQDIPIKVTGNLLVHLYKNANINYGDKLLVKGKLSRAYNFSSGFDYREYLASKGIYALFFVSRDDLLEKQGNLMLHPVKHAAYKIRNNIKNIFKTKLHPAYAAAYNTIILGESKNLPKLFRDNFVKTGTAHVLAVSGLHVGIISLLLFFVLRFCRIPKRLVYFLMIIVLISYCFITGLRISVIRATVMAVVVLVGFLKQKPVHIYNSLSLAALIILVFNPNELFNAGFQLSFVSVFSIVTFVPLLEKAFGFYEWPKLIKNMFFKPVFASFSAWIATMPIIISNFGIVSLISVLANFIIVPYMAVVLSAGFLLILAGTVLPIFNSQIVNFTSIVMHALFIMTSELAKIPHAFVLIGNH